MPTHILMHFYDLFKKQSQNFIVYFFIIEKSSIEYQEWLSTSSPWVTYVYLTTIKSVKQLESFTCLLCGVFQVWGNVVCSRVFQVNKWNQESEAAPEAVAFQGEFCMFMFLSTTTERDTLIIFEAFLKTSNMPYFWCKKEHFDLALRISLLLPVYQWL